MILMINTMTTTKPYGFYRSFIQQKAFRTVLERFVKLDKMLKNISEKIIKKFKKFKLIINKKR